MADGNFGFKVNGFDSYILRLGEELRGERATLGKSLIQVQKDLKIKAAYISAIENTRFKKTVVPGDQLKITAKLLKFRLNKLEWVIKQRTKNIEFYNSNINPDIISIPENDKIQKIGLSFRKVEYIKNTYNMKELKI